MPGLAIPAPTAAPPGSRRAAILDAALNCFVRRGYSSTTIDDIRRASGASVGSLYHHCGGKDRIAAALYVDGLADYQRGFQAVLAEHGDARGGVEAIVAYHLQWVDEHADLARFLLAMRETEVIAAAAPELHRRNRAFFAAVHRPAARPAARAGRRPGPALDRAPRHRSRLLRGRGPPAHGDLRPSGRGGGRRGHACAVALDSGRIRRYRPTHHADRQDVRRGG